MRYDFALLVYDVCMKVDVEVEEQGHPERRAAHWRTPPPTRRPHLISIDEHIDFCVFFQGKGKMRTYWLLGEKKDVYVI